MCLDVAARCLRSYESEYLGQMASWPAHIPQSVRLRVPKISKFGTDHGVGVSGLTSLLACCAPFFCCNGLSHAGAQSWQEAYARRVALGKFVHASEMGAFARQPAYCITTAMLMRKIGSVIYLLGSDAAPLRLFDSTI